MKNSLFAFVIGLLGVVTAHSQHKIKFDIKDYPSDSLIIGYYLGEKTLVEDTLVAQSMGAFVMSGEDSLAHGVYMMLAHPSNEFFQFLITEDQEFSVKAVGSSFKDVKFKGSKENEIFVDYLNFISQKRTIAQPIRDYLTHADSTGLDGASQRLQLDEIDHEVDQYQQNIMINYPDALVSQLIRANMEIDIPTYEGEPEEVNQKRYLHYKKHYFDNIDLADPVTLRTPFIHSKIEYYISNLTPLNPDSIIRSVDSILSWVEPSAETYRFYLSYFINEYANTRVIGMDAVFVHLADNYYARGKADWVSEEILTKIKDNARKIRPTLIGTIVPNITVYEEDGSPISIDDIEYKYLVLFFWAPDCGHCKKAMPDLVKFEENFRDKGVKVFAICTKHQEKTKNCWEMLEEKNMTQFINAADEYHKSRFKIKFNVARTPKIYILDKNREILIKDLGAEHLSEIIDQIIEMEQEKSN